ncbi:uncharacterized protein K452DRAFT_354054 [Aplosporella prunicola CBS 121167]|uniref:Zn(2)-C6 fungal-type domain-containing protein n=1 Tax=Aplosporella prunicola CBS 121167 TaxID=1176127 RepID=A0A6A6AYT4_9PEZI|nr:uncharacterized protein K452DRAFT_354054 [Aplosporella prunicola CBS 121167]KAF2136164.1 hypothetical protein K452DRAFT_354054 [Aplosporella prunicola CBS 121167]
MPPGKQRTTAHAHRASIPYRRTSLACVRCRGRKTKCSGDLPSCRTCRAGNHGCIYLEQERKVQVPEFYLRDLEARVRAYEQSQAPIPKAPSPSFPASASLNPKGSGETEEFGENPLTEGMAHLVMTPSGQRHYLGNSSSTSFGLRLRSFVETLSRFDHDLSIEVQCPTYNPAAWPKRRPSLTKVPQLPPYGFAKRLYKAQFVYIGTIFSFVEPHVFEARLQKAYNQIPDLSDREACLSYSQVLIILAYGQLYSVNQWDGHDGPPGFDYFMQALQFLPDIHDEGSVLFVEVLSLAGYFMQNLNRRDAAFLYTGLALRMAISLGLHQEIDDPEIDNKAREHRRRLWWSVYSMDRILCAKSGNPITILDEDIGVSHPSRLPECEPEVGPATVLLHYTELSRILGKIMNSIYRKNHKPDLVASVYNIMTDLNNWRRDLPQELQFDPNKLGKDISRESVSIFLHYYQCINMTARPLLFRMVQKRLATGGKGEDTDWRVHLSPTAIAVIEACITAARDSTIMMYSAAKQNLVATYGFMDGEHIFSAAIVLVMINLAFPFNERDRKSMKMALEVLCGMAEKGNSHMRARHELLMKLCNIATIPCRGTETSPASFGGKDTGEDPATLYVTPSTIPATNFPLFENEPGLLQSIGSLDGGIWEEGYGNIDIGIDLDWTHWTEAVQGT